MDENVRFHSLKDFIGRAQHLPMDDSIIFMDANGKSYHIKCHDRFDSEVGPGLIVFSLEEEPGISEEEGRKIRTVSNLAHNVCLIRKGIESGKLPDYGSVSEALAKMKEE